MSGGSMDYFSSRIEEYAYDLKDRELIELALDMAQLFHDKEWFDSGDTSEGSWNKSVLEFKNKWLRNNANERIEELINKSCDDLKNELLLSFGCKKFCKDCKNFEQNDKTSNYGDCPYHEHCMMHAYEYCDKFEEKV